MISEAFAMAGNAAAQQGGRPGYETIVMLVLMFAIFYFLLIRPQQKRMTDHKQMVANLRRGDHVITAGGLHGKVTRVAADDEAEIQIAEGVKVRIVKSTIAQVVSKTEPANDG